MENNPRHTPGQWIVSYLDDCAIYTEGGPAIASLRHKDGGKRLDAEANTKRIVDCVNACDGIDDPLAELTRLRGDVERLVQQNVGLVESSDAEFKRYMEAKARAETAEAQLAELQATTSSLINHVNAVTVFHRHGQEIPKQKLDALSNKQLEVEAIYGGGE